MGLLQVPAVTIDDLDEAKLRLLRLALNRLGEESRLGFRHADARGSPTFLRSTLTSTSSSAALRWGRSMSPSLGLRATKRMICRRLEGIATPVTKLGDLWLLDNHRLPVRRRLGAGSYGSLLGEERAQMGCLPIHPGTSLSIAGNVSGLGAVKHEDFVMASGEMSATQFGRSFLRTSLGNSALRTQSTARSTTSLHGLVEDARASRRNRGNLFRIKKPLRLAQTQWRDGIFVSVATTTRVRVQAGLHSAYKQHRTRPPRPQSF